MSEVCLGPMDWSQEGSQCQLSLEIVATNAFLVKKMGDASMQVVRHTRSSADSAAIFDRLTLLFGASLN